MSDDLLRRINAIDLFELQNTGIALTDKTFKVTWFNKSFKKTAGTGRIKGISLTSLFNISLPNESELTAGSKSIVVPLPSYGKNLIITPISQQKKNDTGAFFVELFPLSDYSGDIQNDQIIQNLKFQKELQEILVLLLKEKSVEIISEEVLSRLYNITKSDFGIVVLHNRDDKRQYIYFDPQIILTSKEEIEKAVNYNSSFITKWLELNRRPLLALNHQNNIGYGLVQSLNCESICIAPCYFDNVLQSEIILGKINSTFSSSHISVVEQFATILSFAISNIKTRELNQALESRLLQAQKLETIGKLSSGMAHDFNNLLSSIFGSLNLLRNRVPANESVTRLIDNIENCSIRAKDLTKGLLAFGKPTPKRKEIVYPNLLLTELIKVIVQTFPKNITIEEKVESNLHSILGNSTEIYQILLNLCVNAKEAIEGKGKITIAAENVLIDDKNSINYPLLDKGKYVKLSVSDTGVGIDEENLSKIFDPYFSTKQKDTGSGLGLYVTYGIIKAHNGHVDVSSKVGEGTTFDVYIPAFEPNKIDKTKAANKIIMLADDEEMLSDILGEMLETYGYYVVKVKSSEEVIQVLTEEIKVDLLIIDYNMPQMNGLECVAELRKRNFNMPVILSSGSLSFEDADLEKVKINSKLLKPYEFETMLKTIQELL
jgi:signal transduction histidine kinase/CheY-like chemotaxis protein